MLSCTDMNETFVRLGYLVRAQVFKCNRELLFYILPTICICTATKMILSKPCMQALTLSSIYTHFNTLKKKA